MATKHVLIRLAGLGAAFAALFVSAGAGAFPGAAGPAAPGSVTTAQYGYGSGYDEGQRPRGYSRPPTRGPGYRDYDYKSYNYRAGRGADWDEYRRNTSRKQRVQDYYRMQQRDGARNARREAERDVYRQQRGW